MGSIYGFNLERSYFNGFSYQGQGRTEGLSSTVNQSTGTLENAGDSFTFEQGGTGSTSFTASLVIDATGFTLHEGSTITGFGTFAATTEYEGGFSETDSGEGDISFTLGNTVIQNTKGATFSSYSENQGGVVNDVTGMFSNAGAHVSFSTVRKLTARGLVSGDTFVGWDSTRIPVTVQSVSWFTTYAQKRVALSSSTVQGLHEVVSWNSVASRDLIETTAEFTSSMVSYSVDTAADNKLGIFEGRFQGQELSTANLPLGINGERGLWLIRPPATPEDLNAALAKVGDWAWSKRDGAGIPETKDGAQWTGEGMVTYATEQLSFWSDSSTHAFSLELRSEQTLSYNYVADGKLKKTSQVIPGATFLTTVGERISFSTKRVPHTQFTTCPGIFLVGDEFTQNTVYGITLRQIATYSAETVQLGEYAFEVGAESGSTVFIQAVEGASFNNLTSVSQSVGGDRSPKSVTQAMEFGYVTEAHSPPVCFVQGKARGYVQFHAEGRTRYLMFEEAGGAFLSTEGDLQGIFGTGDVAPCSDMMGEPGRTRLDPPCNCTSRTLERLNTQRTITIPQWSFSLYSTSREVWGVVDDELAQSTQSFNRSSYTSTTTTARPFETFTIHHEWLPDSKASQERRSFAFTVEGPNLLTRRGTVEVTLGGGGVDSAGNFWYSTQPTDNLIFASEKGILSWAGACLDVTLQGEKGKPVTRQATQAGPGARTIGFDKQAMRFSTSPMVALAPGGSPIFFDVTQGTDASHWPALSVETFEA